MESNSGFVPEPGFVWSIEPVEEFHEIPFSASKSVEFLVSHSAPTNQSLDYRLDAIQRPEVDVVSILTVRRTLNGPVPVLQKITGPYSSELYAEILQRPPGLHELVNGAMGGAGILMKREVLQRFWDEETIWFKDVYQERHGVMFDEETGDDLFGSRILGHDIWFFNRCRELGLRCWVDTRVLWGHLKEVDLRDEFVRDMKDAARIERLERELKLARSELSLLKNGVCQ